MRVFEAAACGSLLLTNDLQTNGLSHLFKDGVHIATYREPEELLDKIEYYLRKEAIRERIAAAGREEALARHTYRHRMERILQVVEQGQSGEAGSVLLPPFARAGRGGLHAGTSPLSGGVSGEFHSSASGRRSDVPVTHTALPCEDLPPFARGGRGVFRRALHHCRLMDRVNSIQGRLVGEVMSLLPPLPQLAK